MKLRFAISIGLMCLIAICAARPAETDYDYEEAAPAPAAPAKPARPSLIGRRNPLAGRNVGKATTTTAAPAPKEDEEEVEEEPLEEEEETPPQTSSTTESTRKLKGGIVRPFRSNQDLLETLKKRREQAITNKQNAKAQGHDEEAAPAAAASEPEKPSNKRANAAGGRKRFNAKDKQEAAASETKEEATPARTSRRFRN